MAASAAAAAQQRRKRNREEEEMTAYRREELEQGWEFKILRSATGVFRRPKMLRAVMAEEARAGWELVEKFDNKRLRFKRPVAARSRDASLPIGVDLYRSYYGISESWLGAYMAVGVIVVMTLVVGLLIWINP